MKKLIIAAALICATACSYGAAGVIWFADEGLSPLASCVGGLDESCVTAYLWTFAAADWDSSYETSKGIYDAYKAGTLTAATSQEVMWNDTQVGGQLTATAGGVNYKDSEQYYAAMLFLHSDTGADPDYYMGNWGTELAVDGDYGYAMNMGTVQGGTSSLQAGGGATSWTATAVPEPTSGLLLLLGVAGLALKRRRA